MNRQITNPISKVLLAALTIVAFSFTASSASADEFGAIKRHATSVRNQTRSLLNEINYHYVNTSNYRHLVADVAELRQMSEHIRQVAVHGCDLEHLAADVAEMDRTFAHIANLFDETELLASQGGGQIVGNTRRVYRLVESIGDSIYGMQENLYELTSVVVAQPIQPVVVQRPIYASERPVVRQPIYRQKPAYLPPVAASPYIAQRPSPRASCPSSRRSDFGAGYGGPRGPVVNFGGRF